MAARASLIEIFSSVQGEGLHVGEPTLFVRFGGCDLRCAWCDSETTWTRHPEYEVEREAGSGIVTRHPNPVDPETLWGEVSSFDLRAHRFVSVTGGEPLLQPVALRELALRVRGVESALWLETHGLRVAALEQVIDVVDVVSMDWKLASDVTRAGAGGRRVAVSFDDEHEAFLRVAQQAPECSVTIVVTPHTEDDEWDAACSRIASVDPAIPLIVQPVTPTPRFAERPDAARLFALQRRAMQCLRSVLVIPQTHPILGVR